MATIGLDKLYYAKITEDDAGEETYGTPTQLAKAISADLSVELAEATLYADDGASEIVKEFKSGTLSLGIDDIGNTAASDLTGATIDKNKVLISTGEDGGDPVAVGFRAKKPTASTNTTGSTESSSASLRQTSLPRAIPSLSAHLPSRERSFAETRLTMRVSIRGRQRSPRAMPPLRLLPTGTRMCMSRPIRRSLQEEV